MKTNKYPHIFQPLKVRGLILKNRLQYAPTVTLTCAPDGSVIQDTIDFAAWQADTGVAYVTIGDTPVTHDARSAWLCELNVNSDDCIPGMNRLARIVREHGAEISVELAHAGRGGKWFDGDPPLAVPSASRPLIGGLAGGSRPPLKDADRDDMDYFKSRYVDCAVRCKHAGFRMVMLHCAHGNFLAQWLSPDSNVRTDEYGGSPENRRRYPLEVLKAVREAVGEELVIEIRVSAQEDNPDGYGLAESLDFMEAAQEYVDIIHVSRGTIFGPGAVYTIPTIFSERRLNVAFAAEAKKRLRVPVCVVGNITTLAEAEEIIASGQADIVAMAKSLMTDQQLVEKSLAGREDEIRPCTRCDQCGNNQIYGTSMTCSVNPRFGVHGDIPVLPEAARKQVLIIGGGPGGLEAARTAAARGHRVTLCERSGALGGLLADATVLPFKNYMREYFEWSLRMLERSDVQVLLNTEATPEWVEAQSPDAVIVATGSRYITPELIGIDHPKCMPGKDADAAAADGTFKAERAVVCGAGLTGLETALALAETGAQVTVLDVIPERAFGRGMAFFNMLDMFGRMERAGVQRVGEQRVTRFTDDGVETVGTDGAVKLWPADVYVLCFGIAPDNALGLSLLAKYPQDVYLVGDCVTGGRTYGDAIREGDFAAMAG